MFNWIGRIFGRETAVGARRKNPLLDRAVQASAEVYERIRLREYIDESRRSQLARELYLEINSLCNSADPETACRDRFVESMLRLAALQVLVIPPHPEADDSGLRGQPGISGELTRHLVRICAVNDDLRSLMYEETESIAFDNLWAAVVRLYWETRWLAESLNEMRKIMAGEPGIDDWFQPFLHASSARMEHIYRLEAELPPAFEEQVAREAAMAYAVFADIVISGSEDPPGEWRDYVGESNVPQPDFSQ